MSVRPAPLDRNLSSGSALLCNKWVLGPFTPKETTDYPHAVLGGSIVDPMKLSDSLFSKTFGYGYFLVFISREQRHYDAGPIVNAVQFWSTMLSRIEQSSTTRSPGKRNRALGSHCS